MGEHSALRPTVDTSIIPELWGSVQEVPDQTGMGYMGEPLHLFNIIPTPLRGSPLYHTADRIAGLARPGFQLTPNGPDTLKYLSQTACLPLGEGEDSLLTAIMLSLLPPNPMMRGDEILAAAVSWLVYLWHLPGIEWLTDSLMEGTDDYTIMRDPTSLLWQPRLLVCLWTSLLQRSSSILALPPHEYGEIGYRGLTAGR